MKDEKFPHTRKPLHWWRWGDGQVGSFGATEKTAATDVQRARWRDYCTEDRYQPAFTSLRGLSPHPPEWEGAGS